MASRPMTRTITILVVDDEPFVRGLVVDALSAQGRCLLSASSGEEAVAMASAQKLDAIVLDLKMPGMSGIETLRRLLEIDDTLAAIVLTGYGSAETAREARRLGAYDYVTKPFDMAFLGEVVADSLLQKQICAVHPTS